MTPQDKSKPKERFVDAASEIIIGNTFRELQRMEKEKETVSGGIAATATEGLWKCPTCGVLVLNDLRGIHKCTPEVLALVREKDSSTTSDASIPQMALSNQVSILTDALLMCIRSASPNRVEHKALFRAWQNAENVLASIAPPVAKETNADSAPGVSLPKSDSVSAAARPATHVLQELDAGLLELHTLISCSERMQADEAREKGKFVIAGSEKYWLQSRAWAIINKLRGILAPSVGAVEQKTSGEKEARELRP